MHPKIGFLAGRISSSEILCYPRGRWQVRYPQLAHTQLCWLCVSCTSFYCIDTTCGSTRAKQAPPGTPPQLLHLLLGSRVVMDGHHLMDGCKCVRTLFLVHLDLHVFSIVSLRRGVHSTRTGLSTHLHLLKHSGSDVSTPPSQSHVLHPPREFPPTKSKRGLMATSKVTQVREPRFQWRGQRGTHFFIFYIVLCVGIFLFYRKT